MSLIPEVIIVDSHLPKWKDTSSGFGLRVDVSESALLDLTRASMMYMTMIAPILICIQLPVRRGITRRLVGQ